ncbi:MAG: hypothetical protein QOG80_416, partial [Pseudonocardiales bacterium]|nr:hypothetical protein [Pseudonocardiales bacterium]
LAAGMRRRRDDKFVGAGVGVVAGLFIHGMVDIYWTAGAVTLPFIIFGMAIAHAPSRAAPRHAAPAHEPKMIRSARARTLSER